MLNCATIESGVRLVLEREKTDAIITQRFESNLIIYIHSLPSVNKVFVLVVRRHLAEKLFKFRHS